MAGRLAEVDMADTVGKRGIEIIAEQALMKPEEGSTDAKLEDLGIDSLGLVEAVFAIEESFDINVPFNANDPMESEFDISNIGSMVAAVEQLVEKKAS